MGHSGCSGPWRLGALSAPSAAGPGAAGAAGLLPILASCRLQPGASRARRFLWQGCGVSAGPRPAVCVRARCFLPACPAAPRPARADKGPLSAPLSTACHRAAQQLLTCPGTAASAQRRHPEIRFTGGAGSPRPILPPTTAPDLPLSMHPPYNPMGHSWLPVPPRAGLGLPATGTTPEHAAVTLG